MSQRCQERTHAPQQIWRCQSKNGSRRLPLARPRQYDLELGEKSGLRLDINAAAMLFHDDVVAYRQAKPGAFARRLGREEWVEYFILGPFRDAGPVVANTNFNLVSEIFRRSDKRWLETIAGFCLAFGRGIESVRYQIEQDSRNLLRIDIGHADGRIKMALQSNAKASLFCPGTVIGEVQALIHYHVDVGRAMLAGTFTGVLQHVFHDGVGALAVLNDLFEVALQRLRQFVQFAAYLGVERGARKQVVHLFDQFRQQRREIVDEVERVLDLVGDTGGKLAERGELLRLHQSVLRGAQFLKRGGEFFGACLGFLKQPHILYRDHRLVGKGLHQIDLAFGEGAGLRPRQHQHAFDSVVPEHWNGQRRANSNQRIRGHFHFRVLKNIGNNFD